jgi:hypothetical protein
LQKILEVPFLAVLPQALMKKKVLEPMLLQTGGSVLAAELALEYGWGINLGILILLSLRLIIEFGNLLYLLFFRGRISSCTL